MATIPGIAVAATAMRQFSLYGAGAAVSLACSLLILPVYAGGLSPAEFGILAAGQILSLALNAIARLGIGIGMFRHLVSYHAGGRSQSAKDCIFTCLLSTMCVAVASFVLVFATALALRQRMPNGLFFIALLIALGTVVSAPRDVAELVFRAQQRASLTVTLSSSAVASYTALAAVFVVVLHHGISAIFVATVISNAAISVAALAMLRPEVQGGRLSFGELRRCLAFGLPSVPALLADWITQYSDRFFLTQFTDLSQVGIYSMGYRIALIEQQVLGTAAQTAWDPLVLHNYRRENGPAILGRVSTLFVAMGMALAILLAGAASGLLSAVHARPEYVAAAPVIGIVAMANLLAVLQYMFLVPTSIRLRPGVGLAIRLGASILNVLLNLLLIPPFGYMGAAWATLLTFGMSALVTDVVGRLLWRVGFEYHNLLITLGGGAIILIGLAVNRATTAIASAATATIIAEVALVGLLLVSRVLPVEDLRLVSRFIDRGRALYRSNGEI